jgi:hypothetical protein
MEDANGAVDGAMALREAITSRLISPPSNLEISPGHRLQITDRGQRKGFGPGQIRHVVPSRLGWMARIAVANPVFVRKA